MPYISLFDGAEKFESYAHYKWEWRMKKMLSKLIVVYL